MIDLKKYHRINITQKRINSHENSICSIGYNTSYEAINLFRSWINFSLSCSSMEAILVIKE